MKGFLRIAGKVTDWNVYKKALIICDVTEMFINKYLPRNSRTIDQMRQAARSCKQNIVEGVVDNTVSTEMCIKLLGVAKGSLRELGEDYYDFLRQQGYSAWEINDPRAMQAETTMMWWSSWRSVGSGRLRRWQTSCALKYFSLMPCWQR